MEFLIAVVVFAIAGYIGYKYYQAVIAKQPEVPVLELTAEVQPIIESTDTVDEKLKTQIKNVAAKPKKATKKISVEVIEEVKEIKVKATKKKPNMKIVK